MGLVEEIGELHHHLLKQEQGIRGTWEEHEEAAQDAVGDTIMYALDLCEERGWDLQAIVEKTWAHISQWDWVTDPQRGVVATAAIQNRTDGQRP